MTASDVITAARRVLADEGSPYRWDNTRLTQYVNDALREAVRRRPDLLLKTDHTLQTVADKNIGETLILGEYWRQALAFFVASRALQEDSADKVNLDRAEQYYANFLRSLS